MTNPADCRLHSPRIGPCSREEFNLVSRHKNRSPAAPASAVDANFVQSARIVDERDRARQSFQRRRLDHAYLGAERHASACGFAHETPSTVSPSPGGHLQDPIAHRLDNLNTGQIKPPSPETVETLLTDRCRTHPPSCSTGAVQRFALPRGRSLAPVRRAGRAGCRPDRPQDRLFANSSLAPAASGRCSTSGCPVVTASSDRHSATRRSGRRDTPRATPDSSGLTLPADREPTEAVRRSDHTRTEVRAGAAQVAALASEHTLGTHGGVVGRRLRPPSAMTATSPARNSDHASSSARRLSRKVDRE